MSGSSTFKEQCVIFVEETSFHGLKTLGDAKTKAYRRAFWLLIIVCMFGLLIYYLVKGLTAYLSYPTTTKIMQLENSSLVFPAVTICNNNKLTNMYLRKNPLASNITRLYSPYSAPPSINLSDPTVMEVLKNISYVDMFKEGGHQLQETLFSCQWNEILYPCHEIFTPVISDIHGYCYTFNANGSIISKNPGNLYDLELIVYVGQEWYSHYMQSLAAGIKVLIHEPTAYPSLQINALSVQTGVALDMVISRRQEIFLPHPYDGPGCNKGDYTSLTECKLQCNIKYIHYRCNCDLTETPFEGLRKCSLYDIHQCAIHAAGKEFVKEERSFKPNVMQVFHWSGPASNYTFLETQDQCLQVEYWANKSLEESCGCLHHCSEVSYDVKVTQMTYPSDYATAYINNYLNATHSTEYYRTVLINLKIYYEDFITTVTEQVGSYSFANFSAEMGGYLGLFLGASLLTLTEMLEFVLTLLASQCKCKGIKNKVWNKS